MRPSEIAISGPMCASRNGCGVPVQPAALELLVALAPVLSRWGRWYVFGAQAVVMYGVPRLSADVDVTIALLPDDPERFARPCPSTWCSPGPDSKTNPSMAHAISTWRNLDPRDRSRGPDHREGPRGRPKDLEDARALSELHAPALDADRIERVLRLLEEALGQSDLRPAFQRIRQS